VVARGAALKGGCSHDWLPHLARYNGSIPMPVKRLPMRESVIRRTTISSQRLGAVNLSQGFPDDDTFPELKHFAIAAIAGSNSELPIAERFLQFLSNEPIGPRFADSIRTGIANGNSIVCRDLDEMTERILGQDS